MPEAGPESWKQIVGAELSAITFVRDFVQLAFDGSVFSALTPIKITSARGTIASGDDQFRNRICDQIGKSVNDVTVREGEALIIRLTDGSSISLSLRVEHYPGPEAVVFSGLDGSCVVF